MNDSFRKNIIDIYGKQGQDWFDSLANTTLQLAKKYNLSDLQPVDNMSFNYVAKGYQGEKPIILKLGMNHKAIAREAEALNAYHGIDSPKVLSLEDGLILMERAVPGSTLKDFFPSLATSLRLLLVSFVPSATFLLSSTISFFKASISLMALSVLASSSIVLLTIVFLF